MICYIFQVQTPSPHQEKGFKTFQRLLKLVHKRLSLQRSRSKI